MTVEIGSWRSGVLKGIFFAWEPGRCNGFSMSGNIRIPAGSEQGSHHEIVPVKLVLVRNPDVGIPWEGSISGNTRIPAGSEQGSHHEGVPAGLVPVRNPDVSVPWEGAFVSHFPVSGSVLEALVVTSRVYFGVCGNNINFGWP